MKKNYFKLDGVEEMFATLKDAKDYIYINYTPNERIRYFDGTVIQHIVTDNVLSVTLVDVMENGNIHYSRPVKERDIYGADAKYRIKNNRMVKR